MKGSKRYLAMTTFLFVDVHVRNIKLKSAKLELCFKSKRIDRCAASVTSFDSFKIVVRGSHKSAVCKFLSFQNLYMWAAWFVPVQLCSGPTTFQSLNFKTCSCSIRTGELLNRWIELCIPQFNSCDFAP